MACLLPHTVDEIHALVQKLIHKDSVRQKAMMEIHALVQQPYTTPNHDSKTHKGGSSSEQNTHKPTSSITHGFLTEKEYQQLLQDEGVLRETLEEQVRAEKEWDGRIKKEEVERELFILEFGVQTDSEYETD
ncbi:hypothetical protein Tco_1353003 [Tanacetum coccineum]